MDISKWDNFLDTNQRSWQYCRRSPRQQDKSNPAFDVGEIDANVFARFISTRFATGKRTISETTALEVIDAANGVSGDVQELCAALWDVTATGDEVAKGHIPLALDIIFMRERKGFEKSVSTLTPVQLGVLRALSDDSGKRVYGVEFLKKSGVSGAGAEKRRLESLRRTISCIT